MDEAAAASMEEERISNASFGIEGKESRGNLKGRKQSWAKLFRVDSLNMEAGRVSGHQGHGRQDSWDRTLRLAFQSIGVVYGDIGTSPLYVYSSTFQDGIKRKEDVLGVLSLIIYTLILFPFLKYVFVVLYANDNGDGGTFAIYSLLSRYAKVSLIPNQQAEDSELSHYKLETPSNQTKRALRIKEYMEKSMKAKIILFLITIMATSMLIGGGVFTPCVSVIGAVTGIQEKVPSLTEEQIALISIGILVLLFSIQRFGTDKVGYTFAPIILVWFLFIASIGVFNIGKHEIGVLRAFNPKYIIDYFKRNGKQAWISLAGVILCITGTEAMFADLGHFSVKAIQIGFNFVVLPAVTLSYMGQAAYLIKFPEQVGDAFFKAVPNAVFWPQLIVAIAAAIIASQALISGAFAIISQSQALACFPTVSVHHTSPKYEGQVYIPEVNYVLMIACVVVTGAFKTTNRLGSAYGIAVVSVMMITTLLVTLIMLVIWKTRMIWIILFLILFGGVEMVYLSSAYYKFGDGGYLPMLFALVLMSMMGIWHYAHVKRYYYEMTHKISGEEVRDLIVRLDARRVPGIGLLYTELVHGIPPIFPHLVEKIPSIHSVLIFVTIKHLPISKVLMEERFLFRQIKPREFRMFRCVARYGYNDTLKEHTEFERLLIEELKKFIHHEYFIQAEIEPPSANILQNETDHVASETDILESSAIGASGRRGASKSGSLRVIPEDSLKIISSRSIDGASGRRIAAAQNRVIEEEKQFIEKEMEKGVVYLLAEDEIVAEKDSSIIKKFVINYIYSFMKKNFTQGEKSLLIPRNKLLKVGMTYGV